MTEDAPEAGYIQSFILTMESGAVLLVHVRGEDRPHGLGLAYNAAQEVDESQIWDTADYPVSQDKPQAVGVLTLHSAPEVAP